MDILLSEKAHQSSLLRVQSMRNLCTRILLKFQGVHVPVVLGSLGLRRPFSYDGIADMVHMMFMNYAGRMLAKRHQINRNQLVQQAENSLQAIHNLGVLHGDPIPGNMILNEENG